MSTYHNISHWRLGDVNGHTIHKEGNGWRVAEAPRADIARAPGTYVSNFRYLQAKQAYKAGDVILEEPVIFQSKLIYDGLPERHFLDELEKDRRAIERIRDLSPAPIYSSTKTTPLAMAANQLLFNAAKNDKHRAMSHFSSFVNLSHGPETPGNVTRVMVYSKQDGDKVSSIQIRAACDIHPGDILTTERASFEKKGCVCPSCHLGLADWQKESAEIKREAEEGRAEQRRNPEQTPLGQKRRR